MNWQTWLLFLIALAIGIGLVMYWLIWVTEGAYLGSWAVRWLYDKGASTYDDVKQYDPIDEAAFLGNPLFHRLEEAFGPHSLLLDVATGTARLPLALFEIPFYQGEIIALDLSREMLREAARKTSNHATRITLIHHSSVPLPFEDHSFDAVTSLEALEFMPDRHAALREMVRILSPGGWFIVTNRIGMDAQLMPGHTDSPEQFEQLLASLGLAEVHTRPWQEYYDLIFARKPGHSSAGRGFTGSWLHAMRCPECGKAGTEVLDAQTWHCTACKRAIPIGQDGVWEIGL
ncbi:MAG: methyltransferase domain-containing protein [Ardenticatenales bacterium]|nr:methyltransferase domain-containing protein [Ardenticatenales bacterium]